MNEGLVLRELGTEQVQPLLCANLSNFAYSERNPRFLHLWFHLHRDVEVSVWFLNAASFLQAVWRTVSRRSASTKVLPWSVNSFSTAFEAFILLHWLSFMTFLIKRKAINAHLLPSTGNINTFLVQTVCRTCTAFARASIVVSSAQLIPPYLWFNHDQRGFKALGFHADGYASLEQYTSLKCRIRPMHDVPSVNTTALYRPPENDKTLRFLAYMFLSHFCSLMSSACIIVQTWFAGTRWDVPCWRRVPTACF